MLSAISVRYYKIYELKNSVPAFDALNGIFLLTNLKIKDIIISQVKCSNAFLKLFLQVDYNVVMQILRYMVFIWEDYEKRENGKTKGISKTKQFKKLVHRFLINYTIYLPISSIAQIQKSSA